MFLANYQISNTHLKATNDDFFSFILLLLLQDQDVLELDDLKTQKDAVTDNTMTEKLVDSLKKLHKEHHHDHQNDEELVVATEKPVKVCLQTNLFKPKNT